MQSLKVKSQRKLRDNSNVAYLYILPWVIGFLIFQLYPFISSFVYSFTDFSILNDMKFVGFTNYVEILTHDRKFWPSLIATVKYVLIAVPGKLTFSLFIAMILSMKLRGINFFRTLYYMPSILGSSVAIAILWRFIFARDGALNILLQMIGLQGCDWLGSPKYALGTISILTIWEFGSSMVLFLAALKNVPGELYEAARVDGAGRIRSFFKITLPMISPTILFNLIMQSINAFKEFNAPYLITGGGPLRSTYLYGVMLYENAFKYLKMGYASALSWILFVIIMALTLLMLKTSNRWTYYEDGGEF